jgi:hypothetical protein
MAYLFAIWGCFIAFAASALYRLIVVKRIRRELASQADTSLGEKINGETDFRELLKQHKTLFPHSRTRSLSNVLIGVQLLATGAGVALIVAAQFQPHSMFHLISAAR